MEKCVCAKGTVEEYETYNTTICNSTNLLNKHLPFQSNMIASYRIELSIKKKIHHGVVIKHLISQNLLNQFCSNCNEIQRLMSQTIL